MIDILQAKCPLESCTDDEEETGSQHTGPGLSPVREAFEQEDFEGTLVMTTRPKIRVWPLPGVDECVLEVKAFVRGGRPGLERLRLVLFGIFDAFLIREHDEQRMILQKCGLDAVSVQCRVSEELVVDRISFLIPLECQSPAWTRRVRPRFQCSSPPWTAPGSPA